jgi:hypothetical protein
VREPRELVILTKPQRLRRFRRSGLG